MIRIEQVKAGVDEAPQEAFDRVCGKRGIRGVKSFRIAKKAIDARRKSEVHYVYAFDVECDNEERLCGKYSDIKPTAEYQYEFPKGVLPQRPVIVGFGPAGMFAGLVLAQNGAKPLILERGKCVEERAADVEKMRVSGIFTPESNVQFGEGGAGTFSDGKLTTGIKDSRIRKVLEEFVKHGAPEEIEYLSKPHLGTDNLQRIVKGIREEIISLGGEVRFNSRVTDILTDGGRVSGVEVNSEYTEKSDAVILAAGHSARDIFEMLLRRGIMMEQKAFSVGARIEHLQEMISRSQYGDFYKKLPPADYKQAVHLDNGRSVYTFCMCPGGEVIAAASETGGVVTNGMSLHARAGINANSAVLVSVVPSDFGGDSPLAGIELQRRIERAAFEYAGGTYSAVAQTVGDFLNKRPSEGAATVFPTYRPSVKWGELDSCLPSFVTESMRAGITLIGKRISGFDMPDAVLTAPETRSSSPVRLIRSRETFELSIAGLYSAGEGGGHAGGITSAAVDGIKCAEHLVRIGGNLI